MDPNILMGYLYQNDPTDLVFVSVKKSLKFIKSINVPAGHLDEIIIMLEDDVSNDGILDIQNLYNKLADKMDNQHCDYNISVMFNNIKYKIFTINVYIDDYKYHIIYTDI